MTLNNWVADLSDSLPLSLAVMPGSHNSCARIVALPHVTKCQDFTITEQLYAGVRYFDIRLELTKHGIKTVHSVIDCRKKPFSPKKLFFFDVFTEVAGFLSENPSELVILCVKRDNGPEADKLYSELYTRFVKPHEELWFLENRIPTVGECRGKAVLLRRDATSTGCVPSPFGLDLSDCFDRAPDDDIGCTITTVSSAVPPFTVTVQDNYAVPPKRKWIESVLPCLEKKRAGESALLINFLSCNNGIHSPRNGAEYINNAFSEQMSEKGAYGIIVCDYATEELCKKIIGLNPDFAEV